MMKTKIMMIIIIISSASSGFWQGQYDWRKNVFFWEKTWAEGCINANLTNLCFNVRFSFRNQWFLLRLYLNHQLLIKLMKHQSLHQLILFLNQYFRREKWKNYLFELLKQFNYTVNLINIHRNFSTTNEFLDVEQPYCILELNHPKQIHQTSLAKNGLNPYDIVHSHRKKKSFPFYFFLLLLKLLGWTFSIWM